MEFKQDFMPLSIDGIHADAEARKAEGWRYVQMLAVNKEYGADVVYSYMLDGCLRNLVVSDVPRSATLPSITDLYLEAFVCENEIHDLFGISFDGLAIDFLGNFYHLSTEYPMTILSPAQAQERAKAKKAAEDASEDDMEAKLKAMDPEKAAKVRAAMEAKAKKAKEAEMEEKLAGMDPEKAAKVRAAMEAKAKKAAAGKDGE